MLSLLQNRRVKSLVYNIWYVHRYLANIQKGYPHIGASPSARTYHHAHLPKQLKHFSRAADIWQKPGAGISCACRAFGEAAVLDAARRGLPDQERDDPWPRTGSPQDAWPTAWPALTGRPPPPTAIRDGGRTRPQPRPKPSAAHPKPSASHPRRWRSGSCSAPWCWPRSPLPATEFKAEETGNRRGDIERERVSETCNTRPK